MVGGITREFALVAAAVALATGIALWRAPASWRGLAQIAGTVLLAQCASVPDLLVSSDGRHFALRLPDGRLVHSSERIGDFLVDNLAKP